MKNNIEREIINLYIEMLSRQPTNYENHIYSNAMLSGFSKDQLKDTITKSSEYNYIKKIKNNIPKQKEYSNNLKNKKIGVCISGHARNLNKTYLNFLKNLFSELNVNVFIHTWDTTGEQKSRSDSIGIGYNENKLSNDLLNNIKKINPKKIIIENFLLKINKFKIPDSVFMYGAPVNNQGIVNSTARPENIISQLYSINRSLLLLEEYETQNKMIHDLIIKLRFDFSLDSKLSEENIIKAINDERIIYTLDKRKSSSSFENCIKCKKEFHEGIHDSIISDLLLFGSAKSMKKYMRLYDDYYEIYNRIIKDVNLENIRFTFENRNIKFIGDLDVATYKVPCFFPERLLMDHLSELRVLEADLFGQVVR